jgi:lipopolysaccharide/colanic/teichoic acid biosynthesis glycosyltransferase/glycosyltransferase involved in cell wall biosynthesis
MATPKLLYLATSDLFWGFLEGQARYAKARGFEVHAASSPGPGLDTFARREGATSWPLPMTRRVTPLQDLAALRQLRNLLRDLRPAVVHAHTPKAGLLGMMAARWSGVPARIYTLHGLVWQTRRGWRRALLMTLERLACLFSTQVLAVSPSVRDAAIASGLVPPEKIVVPGPAGSANGLDFERFDPRRAASNCCGIPPGALVLGYVGRLTPDKGIAELAVAWDLLRERYPTLHLLLAGDTEAHDPLPPALVSRLRRDPRVRWPGWVADMPDHYLAMNVCVLPSRREGLPYAAIEAAAMERPVVAFAVAGVVDAVEDRRTGLLVAPGSPALLASAIARLLDDPDLGRRLGRAARRRALALYAREPLWDSVCQHYLPVISEARWKRPLDATVALMLLAVLGPVLLLAALAVWIDLGRPILFRQDRPGRGERLFSLLKLRTMREDGAPLTRLGRCLRRASLDELPQLWNILRGDMSLVGPRPLLARYLPYYTGRERLRHRVRPGLTGWAQIHGRNDLAWRERLELDAWYAEHASFRLDLRILWRTLGWWLTGRGVREQPAAYLQDLDQERQCV